MEIVGAFTSPIRAMQAVAYLRQHGVAAQASSGPVGISSSVNIFVLNDQQALQARTLLEGFPANAHAPDRSWEAEALPDLSKLPKYVAPPCPQCHRPLPLDNSVRACPRCGAGVDIAALIVKFHGPEKLMQCYPDDAVYAGGTIELPCSCGYDLRGLSRRGNCPECGAAYEKPGLHDW